MVKKDDNKKIKFRSKYASNLNRTFICIVPSHRGLYIFSLSLSLLNAQTMLPWQLYFIPLISFFTLFRLTQFVYTFELMRWMFIYIFRWFSTEVYWMRKKQEEFVADESCLGVCLSVIQFHCIPCKINGFIFSNYIFNQKKKKYMRNADK